MAKRPALGEVKTRLAKGLGSVAATRFYRLATAALLRRMSGDPRWQTVLALSPDRAVHEAGVFPAAGFRIAQGEGDLGHRMSRLMRHLPPGPVVIIGSDIPDISQAHIAAAFRALQHHDVVFGPSDDGGYWLVGLRRRPRVVEIFGDVRWSSEHALADTLRNVTCAGLSAVLLDQLTDIDTAEVYRRWRSRQHLSLLSIR
jgi:rSAM/selenodomain-associated transferase 1